MLVSDWCILMLVSTGMTNVVQFTVTTIILRDLTQVCRINLSLALIY